MIRSQIKKELEAVEPIVPKISNYSCQFYDLLDSPGDLIEIQVCFKSWLIGFMNREWNDPEEISEGKLDSELFTYQIIDDMLDKLILNSYNQELNESDSKACIADAFYSLSNELHSEKDNVRNWFLGFLPCFADRTDRLSLMKHLHAFGVLIELFYAFIYWHQEHGKVNSQGETLYKQAA